jgi:protein Tex
VDIGVHQDGLVHVSQLADRFVKDPAEVVKVQQKVMVTVIEIDLPRKRIALSMKANPQIGPAAGGKPARSPQPPSSLPPGKRPSAAQPVDWFTEALGKTKRPEL